MTQFQPAKIFPLPFGDLRVDPNTLTQTAVVWITDGSAPSFETFMARLRRADPALVAAAAHNAYVSTWLENLYESARYKKGEP